MESLLTVTSGLVTAVSLVAASAAFADDADLIKSAESAAPAAVSVWGPE